MKVKAADPEQRFLELLKKYSWNKAVRILKEERQAEEMTDEIEELDEEPGYAETEDRAGLRPVAKDTGLGLIADDDRLMAFLEDDIEAMEAEQEAEERKSEENWKKP